MCRTDLLQANSQQTPVSSGQHRILCDCFEMLSCGDAAVSSSLEECSSFVYIATMTSWDFVHLHVLIAKVR